MRAKEITIICFGLLLSAAAFASEQHRHRAMNMEIHEAFETAKFEFHVIGTLARTSVADDEDEVDVTN